MSSAIYLVIDTEATGLIPGRHGLIQVACAALDRKFQILDNFCVDVCPPESVVVEQEALEINGFTLERIKKGISYLQVATQLFNFLEKNFVNEPVMIGQFYPFDYAMLVELCRQTGEIGKQLHQKIGNNFIDTKVLVNIINLKCTESGKKPVFPVVSLSKPGGVKEVLKTKNYQSHDAMGDVLATREVLIKLVKMIKIT